MPDVAAVRDRLPVVIYSEPWQCCGTKGITILKAVGKSQWTLLAHCNTCKAKLAIYKRGVVKEKRK